MTPHQEQLFDEAILRVLDRNISQFGLGASALQVLVGEFGFSPKSTDEVVRRLDYLTDPKIDFVTEVKLGHHKANRSWKITAEGTDHLRSRGL